MLQSRWLILFCDRKVFCGPPLLGEGKKWVRQWLVLAAQPTSSGLFGCSWTEDEELLNWPCHLTECQVQCLIFGVPGPCSLGDIPQPAAQEGCGKVHSDLDFTKATQGM